MIAGLKPYQEYKESGSRWLARVPAHWEVRNLRTLIRPCGERNRADLPLLSVAREKGVFVRSSRDVDENHNIVPEDLSNYKVARVGNLVVNKMKAWQGSMGIAPCDGIVSPAYFVFDFSIANLAFGQALLRSKPYVAHFGQASDGVRIGQWDLTVAGMRQIPVLVPPPEEQAAIARFLDYADRRIRRYIGVKQKLVKLLEEQKQVVIHRAVNQGLEPDVRLKPSSTEWLGDVPEHWELWQIGQFARIGNGSTPSRGNPRYWNGGSYPWLNSSSANQEFVAHADQFVTEVALRECHLPIVHPDSVLVAITGQGKTRGKATVLRIEATINQHIAFMTPIAAICSAEYLRLSLAGAYPQLRAMSDDSGSTKGALTCADLRHFKLALPPLAEQSEILRFVGAQIHKCSLAIERANREVALLLEYRTRLIADVVTGKLDVREAAARLPDGVDEPESLADADALEEGDEDNVDEDLDAAPDEADE